MTIPGSWTACARASPATCCSAGSTVETRAGARRRTCRRARRSCALPTPGTGTPRGGRTPGAPRRAPTPRPGPCFPWSRSPQGGVPGGCWRRRPLGLCSSRGPSWRSRRWGPPCAVPRLLRRSRFACERLASQILCRHSRGVPCMRPMPERLEKWRHGGRRSRACPFAIEYWELHVTPMRGPCEVGVM